MTDTTMIIAAAQGDAEAWKKLAMAAEERAMAAEARCARLHDALTIARAELSELANVMSREDCYPMIDAALSDTAQETGDE